MNKLTLGDLNTGRSNLRDYIDATITIEYLANKLNKSSKSIHLILGLGGNPKAENILEIIKILQMLEA